MLRPKWQRLHQRLQQALLITVFVLTGCQPKPQTNIDLTQFTGLKQIKDYLSAKVASTGFGGKAYCTYEILAAEAKGNNTHKLYLWVLCQEYYRNGQGLQQGTGSSFPTVLTLPEPAIDPSKIRHQRPRDGAFYLEDMQAIFPESVRRRLASESTTVHNQRVKRLQQETQNDAAQSPR
jgi:hypothetical protein